MTTVELNPRGCIGSLDLSTSRDLKESTHLCVVLPGHHSRTFRGRGEMDGAPGRPQENLPTPVRPWLGDTETGWTGDRGTFHGDGKPLPLAAAD